MSDLEKLFEHAPEGATEIVTYRDHDLRWATDDTLWADEDQRWVNRGIIWKTIATRPQPEQPRKTVEDAVEWCNGVWIGVNCNAVSYNPPSNRFSCYNSEFELNEYWYHVCTREEFEACVAAKSEPEWTHVLNSGVRCKFFKSLEWMQGDVYESEDGKFFIPQRTGKSYSIKPIKPTISKDEKAQLELYVQYRIDKYGDHAMKSDLIDYLAKHEVVK